MNWKQGAKIAVGLGLSCVLGAEAGWAAYSAMRWLRYPSKPVPVSGKPTPLDPFVPAAEVDERLSVRIGAPVAAVIAAARELDFERIPVIRAIFAARALLLRAGGAGIAGGPFLAQVESLGWALLAEDPGRVLVFGAVTQPWERNVVFRSLAPAEFIAFDEPGFVKIAWSLCVEPSGTDGSVCTTQTRALTTDVLARRKFRRYWAVFSPGILLIRQVALHSIKAAAERRA